MEDVMEHLLHLTNCHGEISALFAGLGSLGVTLPFVRYWRCKVKSKQKET